MDSSLQPQQHTSDSTATGLAARLDWRSGLGVGGLLVVLVALLYAPALHAPWYMDDSGAILQNPQVRDLDLHPGTLLFQRGLAVLTFALNYRLGGTDPFGYHLINLGLHSVCGWLVFVLLRPVVRNDTRLAALGALLFVVHPLQTQAVTYIVQRTTLLAALFFLLALVLFTQARARLAAGAAFAAPAHLRPYLGGLACGLGAIASKENAAVLPVALYLYVVFFLPPATDRKRLLLSLLPYAVAPLVFAVVRLLLPLTDGATLVEITRTTDLLRSEQLSPLRYLVTEFSVLWVYLRLLVLPYGQALDHNYPLATNLLAMRHLLAGLGLALLGGLACYLRRRQPLVSAGITWFFLTLVIESSVIPLDPLFEHRLYLPLFGGVVVFLGLLRLLPGRNTGIAVLSLAILLCLPLTWERNRLWADPVSFFSDNIAKAPHSERAHTELANLYLNAGRLSEAEPLLLRALQLNPEFLPAYVTLVAVYNDQTRLPEAIAVARQGLERYPRSDKLRTYLGALYFNSGQLELALQTLSQELAIHPNYLQARIYFAKTLAGLGRWSAAESALRQALTLDDANLELRNELAFVLLQQDKLREAEGELRQILARDGENRDALFNLGLLAYGRGDRHGAAALLQRLRRVDPGRAEELARIGTGSAGSSQNP